MAIFNPANQGSQGANAMFNNINQAMQRLQEQKQMQRNDEFVSKLKGQGLLGVASEDVINPTTGKVKLSLEAKSVKEHFNELGGSKKMKDLRKVFGPTATADDVKAYITQQARSRDQKIGEAITGRMEELGLDVENPSSGDIWKVVDKGDKAFKSWYNATDEATRKQLRALGYHPDQEEIGFLPDFLEKAVARGDLTKSGAGTLLGASVLGSGAVAGEIGRRFGSGRVKKSYMESIKSNKDLQAIRDKRQSLIDNRNKYKKQLTALRKELKGTKKKKARKKIEAKIEKVRKLGGKANYQMRQYLVKKDGAYESATKGVGRPGGRTQMEKDIRDIKRPLKSKSKNINKNIGKGALARTGLGIGSAIGGGELGGLIGKSIGGETGAQVGSLAGSIAPSLLKSIAKRTGQTFLASQLVDGGLLTPIDALAIIGGVGAGVYDHYSKK